MVDEAHAGAVGGARTAAAARARVGSRDLGGGQLVEGTEADSPAGPPTLRKPRSTATATIAPSPCESSTALRTA